MLFYSLKINRLEFKVDESVIVFCYLRQETCFCIIVLQISREVLHRNTSGAYHSEAEEPGSRLVHYYFGDKNEN